MTEHNAYTEAQKHLAEAQAILRAIVAELRQGEQAGVRCFEYTNATRRGEARLLMFCAGTLTEAISNSGEVMNTADMPLTEGEAASRCDEFPPSEWAAKVAALREEDGWPRYELGYTGSVVERRSPTEACWVVAHGGKYQEWGRRPCDLSERQFGLRPIPPAEAEKLISDAKWRGGSRWTHVADVPDGLIWEWQDENTHRIHSKTQGRTGEWREAGNPFSDCITRNNHAEIPPARASAILAEWRAEGEQAQTDAAPERSIPDAKEIVPVVAKTSARRLAETATNADSDTLADIKAAWEQSNSVDICVVDGGIGEHTWHTRNKGTSPCYIFYRPVSAYRLTARHADTFDPTCMDFETWARSAIGRGMVLRGEDEDGVTVLAERWGRNGTHAIGAVFTKRYKGCVVTSGDAGMKWTAHPRPTREEPLCVCGHKLDQHNDVGAAHDFLNGACDECSCSGYHAHHTRPEEPANPYPPADWRHDIWSAHEDGELQHWGRNGWYDVPKIAPIGFGDSRTFYRRRPATDGEGEALANDQRIEAWHTVLPG